MRGLVREAMRDGCFGLSTGLVYPPGAYADTEELVELARAVAEAGGFYASHIRGEGHSLLRAVAEALEIGERAGLPVQISHHKAASARTGGACATRSGSRSGRGSAGRTSGSTSTRTRPAARR
jgi:N-acyl-D-aspartate/D-glutamate deacylase